MVRLVLIAFSISVGILCTIPFAREIENVNVTDEKFGNELVGWCFGLGIIADSIYQIFICFSGAYNVAYWLEYDFLTINKDAARVQHWYKGHIAEFITIFDNAFPGNIDKKMLDVSYLLKPIIDDK